MAAMIADSNCNVPLSGQAERRLFAGSGARPSVLALYADLPFMYVFVLVADDLWAGRVFKGDGGSQGWRRLGCYQASRVVATGACAMQVSSATAWPRGSWAMPVVQTTALDPDCGMSAAAGRSRAAGGDMRGSLRAADPAAALGPASPGVARLVVWAHCARRVPLASASVPVAGPGVMMVLEISAWLCRGVVAAFTEVGVVQARLARVARDPICGRSPSGGAGFGRREGLGDGGLAGAGRGQVAGRGAARGTGLV
jgi:hypothetical protein